MFTYIKNNILEYVNQEKGKILGANTIRIVLNFDKICLKRIVFYPFEEIKLFRKSMAK